MNAERLHAIAISVGQYLQSTNTLGLLQALSKALQAQVSQPQEPSHQQTVADRLAQLTEKLEQSPAEVFPPTWYQALEEFDVDGLFGEALVSRVKEIFAGNQITPTIVRDEINALVQRLSNFQETLSKIRDGFEALSIGAEKLEAGDAEIGILIPRDFVDHSLDKLGAELDELNGILLPFSEIAGEGRPSFKVRTLSSSDISVFLVALPPIARALRRH